MELERVPTCFGKFDDEVYSACRYSADPDQMCDLRDSCLEETKKVSKVDIKPTTSSENVSTTRVEKKKQVLEDSLKLARFCSKRGFEVEEKGTCWKITYKLLDFSVSVNGVETGTYSIIQTFSREDLVTSEYVKTKYDYILKTKDVSCIIAEIERLFDLQKRKKESGNK